MKKTLALILTITLIGVLIFSLHGCKSREEEVPLITDVTTRPIEVTTYREQETTSKPEEVEEIVVEPDWYEIKPDESGRIMVVMFHNFLETFTPSTYDKGEYTMTFDAFRELLEYLYEKDYRLISFEDFINNDISVPAGKIPMVFTFDDATKGQFYLEEENGEYKTAADSAVGMMEDFNKEYPDFGMHGIFFVNMGSDIFRGAGNKAQRISHLVDLGFEIGNHTYGHADLTAIKTKEKIQEEVGKNQKALYDIIPDYEMIAFSLPYGNPSKELKEYVIRGEYEGVKYENRAVLEVGWNPSYSVVNVNFDPYSVNRVRSPGIEPVQFDLYWWVENMKRSDEYISDGDPDRIAIPAIREDQIDMNELKDKELFIWDKD